MNLKEFFSTQLQDNKDISRDLAWYIIELTHHEPIEWDTVTVTPKLRAELKRGISRLKKGEPLGYILGNVPFWDCNIMVGPDVLIPRAETEQLCELVVRSVGDKRVRVLDLCTGSGCIAIALAKKLNAEVLATDISEASVAIARKNALNNLTSVNFVVGDMFEKVGGKFDVIVSNPPYISAKEYTALPKSVVKFEPQLALMGGEDGLDFYRIIASQARKYLNPKGAIFLEVGDTQAENVVALFKDFDCEIVEDYFGFNRFVIARSRDDR